MDVEALALVWLLTRPEGRGTPSELRRALAPLLAARLSAPELRRRLDAALEALVAAGHVARRGRGGLVLSEGGRARAQAALGGGREGRREVRPRWSRLVREQLTARALGLPPEDAQAVGSAEGLMGLLLARAAGVEEALAVGRARDVLLWRQLGVDWRKPFTLKAVRALLLNRALGTQGKAVDVVLRQLAAREAGARRADGRALREAVLEKLVVDGPVEPPDSGGLAAFAARALKAAAQSATGRFGERKVFISHAWAALGEPRPSLEDFKARLVEASQARYLDLARADLVEAMDPADVARSETHGPASTFHFVQLPRGEVR